jgi:carbonic anhydrase
VRPPTRRICGRSWIAFGRPSSRCCHWGRAYGEDALVREAVRANVRASVNQLRHGSELLENLIHDSGLWIVGAEYSLETGVVDFFENVPMKL